MDEIIEIAISAIKKSAAELASALIVTAILFMFPSLRSFFKYKSQKKYSEDTNADMRQEGGVHWLGIFIVIFVLISAVWLAPKVLSSLRKKDTTAKPETETVSQEQPESPKQVSQTESRETVSRETVSIDKPVDAKSQYELARHYEYVLKNKKQAVYWYRKSAEQGYAEAQERLGLKYSRGDGVKQNKAEAVKWWRKAAEQGHKQAQYWMGWSCYNGNGIKKNHAEAFKWFYAAAQQGYMDAQYWVGFMYRWGQGTKQNYSEALKWFRKAALQGHKNAKERIADLEKLQKGE